MGEMLQRLGINPISINENEDLFCLRSAEWNPWLAEKDNKFENFIGALRTAADEARKMVLNGKKIWTNDIIEKAGVSGLKLAYGIAVALGMRIRMPNSDGSAGSAQEIGNALSALKQKLSLKDLPGKALSHFRD